MTLNFLNLCRYNVNITIGEKKEVVNSNTSTTLENASEKKIEFSVKSEDRSNFYKGKYFIFIETTYECYSNLGELSFVLTEEISRVFSNIYYVRLRIETHDASYNILRYAVLDKNKLKKAFIIRKVARFFFLDPIEYLPGLFIGSVGISVWLWHFFRWKFAIVFFIAAYIVLLLINLFSEGIFNFFLKTELIVHLPHISLKHH